ncbi:MAG: DUF305 domain-containing protein [Cyanobacteriota bacterium]
MALRRWSIAAGITAGLLHSSAKISGCAFADPPPSGGTAPMRMGMQAGSRSVDQHFIVMMIPHHDGAISMAELALVRSKRPEIIALAEQIKTSQTAENTQMRSWYRQWYGTEVPAWTAAGMGMGMGQGMPGMATSLDALTHAPDFDRAFIEQMIPHHRMGVMMASHAGWHTQRRELRDLQAAMVKAQREEIDQMEQWYRQWYGVSGR